MPITATYAKSKIIFLNHFSKFQSRNHKISFHNFKNKNHLNYFLENFNFILLIFCVFSHTNTFIEDVTTNYCHPVSPAVKEKIKEIRILNFEFPPETSHA